MTLRLVGRWARRRLSSSYLPLFPHSPAPEPFVGPKLAAFGVRARGRNRSRLPPVGERAPRVGWRGLSRRQELKPIPCRDSRFGTGGFLDILVRPEGTILYLSKVECRPAQGRKLRDVKCTYGPLQRANVL